MPQVAHIEPGPDTFSILLTTDNHVGYMESDPIRGDDSWLTLAEIMKIAQDEDVDMIVQGGDLFHINTPSKRSYYNTMRILRQYCWNGKPIEYRLLSDPGNAIATKHFDYPAEYDKNINVGMPMYAISGNHDDATGDAMLSPLDLLGISGLINHFGKVPDNEQIQIFPLLFNKGKTHLALFGLPSIREERLMKTMASGNMEFMEPDSDEDIQWFNLMCIHQNHVHRPGVKVVEETSLPTFLDFVLWGHEHDCHTSCSQNDITGTHILQAGSSIATSLSMGETLPKHVFLLNIKEKDFSLKPIKLRTVRPFVMKEVALKDTRISASSSNKSEVLNFLILQVELMIKSANDMWRNSNKDLFEEGLLTENDTPLPLIRLRVDYSGGYEVENPRYFSNRFVGKVANINDVVIYHKKNKKAELLTLNDGDLEKGVPVEEEAEDEEDGNLQHKNKTSDNIIEIIKKQLQENELIMLDRDKFAKTLNQYLSNDDKSVMPMFLKQEEEEYVDLMSQMTMGQDFNEELILQKGANMKSKFKELVKEVRAQIQRSDTQSHTQSHTQNVPAKQNKPIVFKGKQKTVVKTMKSEPVVVESDSDVAEEVIKETKKMPKLPKHVKSTPQPVYSSDDMDIDVVPIQKPPPRAANLNSMFLKKRK